MNHPTKSRRLPYTDNMADTKSTGSKKPPVVPSSPPVPAFVMGEDKRSKILRAAMVSFLNEGYSVSSMDSITRSAGVSKATVYSHFKSKQALFETLVKEGSSATLDSLPPLNCSSGRPREELLTHFQLFLYLIFKGGYAWNRMIISEATRHPENARLFYECTITKVTQRLIHFLTQAKEAGTFAGENLTQSAETFLSIALIGPLHRALILGPEHVDYSSAVHAGVDYLFPVPAGS